MKKFIMIALLSLVAVVGGYSTASAQETGRCLNVEEYTEELKGWANGAFGHSDDLEFILLDEAQLEKLMDYVRSNFPGSGLEYAERVMFITKPGLEAVLHVFFFRRGEDGKLCHSQQQVSLKFHHFILNEVLGI